MLSRNNGWHSLCKFPLEFIELDIKTIKHFPILLSVHIDIVGHVAMWKKVDVYYRQGWQWLKNYAVSTVMYPLHDDTQIYVSLNYILEFKKLIYSRSVWQRWLQFGHFKMKVRLQIWSDMTYKFVILIYSESFYVDL